MQNRGRRFPRLATKRPIKELIVFIAAPNRKVMPTDFPAPCRPLFLRKIPWHKRPETCIFRTRECAKNDHQILSSLMDFFIHFLIGDMTYTHLPFVPGQGEIRNK